MSTKVFIALNVVYFIVDYVCIPLFNPNGVVFGFIPFQQFAYAFMGIVAAGLWGTYFTRFFSNQKRYDDDGNIIR